MPVSAPWWLEASDHSIPEMVDPDPFAPARIALERGDYGVVLGLLEPLVQTFPPATAQGADLQLLMATAWMGMGNSGRAMVCCRQVLRCRDAGLRAQAKDLLAVLEAPALERPREWSITLPPLGEAEPIAGRMKQWAQGRRSKKSSDPPPPPVGLTQTPLGFGFVVVVVLLLLGVLLGGCVDIHAQVRFAGPGRLQLAYQLDHDRSTSPPWQRQFSQVLRRSGFQRAKGDTASNPDRQSQSLQAPVMAAGEALALLRSNLESAAQLAGIHLPMAELSLKERNWLVGVHQQFLMVVDLRSVQPMAGVNLSIDLAPVRRGAVQRAEPDGVLIQRSAGERRSAGVSWPIHFGALNQLELQCWRWSPLGLGALGIMLTLVVVLALQRLRLNLGFGLPQLPA